MLHDEYIIEVKLSLCIYKADIAFLFTGPCFLLTAHYSCPLGFLHQRTESLNHYERLKRFYRNPLAFTEISSSSLNI